MSTCYDILRIETTAEAVKALREVIAFYESYIPYREHGTPEDRANYAGLQGLRAALACIEGE